MAIFVKKATWHEIAPKTADGTALAQDAETRSEVNLETLEDESDRSNKRAAKDVPEQASVAGAQVATSRSHEEFGYKI